MTLREWQADGHERGQRYVDSGACACRRCRRADPVLRRILAHDRARARVGRRVAALLAYLDADPMRGADATTRRLDNLLGQADRLTRALR